MFLFHSLQYLQVHFPFYSNRNSGELLYFQPNLKILNRRYVESSYLQGRRRENLIGVTCWDFNWTLPYSNPLKSSTQPRKTNPTKEPDPHSQRTERDSERGEGDLDESGREKTQPDQRGPNPFKSLSDFISKDRQGGGWGVVQVWVEMWVWLEGLNSSTTIEGTRFVWSNFW